MLLICVGIEKISAQVPAKEDTIFFLAHKKGLLGKILYGDNSIEK